VSLAHCGVLFLDEAPEFRSGVLDALRQPLESGSIALARSGGTLTLPARFQLVMAANPCPCGHFGSMDRTCECAPMNVRRYSGRLSGPLLDRVDLQLAVRAVDRAELLGAAEAESTASVVTRVTSARAAAAQRWRQAGWRLNADVPGRELRGRWRPDAAAIEPLYRALDQGRLSARGADRVLRVAWTLADLGGRAAPDRRDVAAALRFRSAAGAVAA
jgi:magnesium chelatase family protein